MFILRNMVIPEAEPNPPLPDNQRCAFRMSVAVSQRRLYAVLDRPQRTTDI